MEALSRALAWIAKTLALAACLLAALGKEWPEAQFWALVMIFFQIEKDGR